MKRDHAVAPNLDDPVEYLAVPRWLIVKEGRGKSAANDPKLIVLQAPRSTTIIFRFDNG
ncbi:hypothetical protein M8997_009065 [Phyllobacterium sp. 21LDTY02-6]|uniref:hypothetical protein n=1 Tax=Phyllobacterium sp. 21LDTY02-6 TaxID=2944903 RepID=UPI002021CD40|nr:hypothetical protein [Phyllobacterium sp. 21LDTY02-6]MCO4317330.1 hypothetical protein [Phyllobacterium sp. 21LDTY02-6]